MTSPFKFRPTDIEADVDKDGEVADWEDTKLSNAMAWGSVKFTPTLCQDESHWSSRFAVYLHTSCPCCMIFRGLIIGLFAGLSIGALIGAIIFWLFQ